MKAILIFLVIVLALTATWGLIIFAVDAFFPDGKEWTYNDETKTWSDGEDSK